jgi:hypothetical protein
VLGGVFGGAGGGPGPPPPRLRACVYGTRVVLDFA